MAAELNPLRG
jgi:hypothetical protein